MQYRLRTLLMGLAHSLRPRFSLRSMFVATLACALALAASQLANVRLPGVYTGRPLDLAIDGPGYFQLTEPFDDSRVYYTRSGRFWVGPDSQICFGTPEQNLRLSPVQSLPMDAQATIDAQGSVYASVPGTSSP